MEQVTAEQKPIEPLPQRDGWLCFGTAWAQGFLEGGMITFLALYLLSLHYSAEAVGSLHGVLFLGVILAQLPLSYLADIFGKLSVLLICLIALMAGLIFLPLFATPLAVVFCLFLLGASCGRCIHLVSHSLASGCHLPL